MKEVKTQRELAGIMMAAQKAGRNTWCQSQYAADLYFWNTEGKEHGDPSFPVVYARLDLLNKVSKKMFGSKGFLMGVLK